MNHSEKDQYFLIINFVTDLLPGTEYLVEVVTVFGDRRSVPVSGRVETSKIKILFSK